jgi:hypothetical protein
MTPEQWQFFADQGLMRVRYESDPEPYDDSYIDTWDLTPEEIKEEKRKTWRIIEAYGVWGLIGEYRVSTDSPWVQAYSVWGCIGRDSPDYEEDARKETYNEFRRL